MTLPERFSGKTCLITGAATGIGRATALRFADQGAHVVIGDIADEKGAEVCQEIVHCGGSADFLHTDVTDPDALRAFVQFGQRARNRIDVVFANAAVLDPAPIEEFSDSRFEHTMRANLLHPFVIAREAAPHLRSARGSIVISSSTGGLRGIVGQAGYSSTKAAVINLARVLAAELGPEARANAICPGWVDTPFNDSIWELLGGKEREAELMAGVPLRRQAQPDEIAAAVLFLASDDASYITGHALIVDGGLTAV